MTERHVTIHCHFYQPPRENPWLEAIERQESAHPWHDWNERILAECYAPNAWSRVLDAEGRIVRIVNNYERISFNVGPTLLAWLEPHAPGTYAAILEADRRSRQRFSGHGNALAQAYGHMILPLAGPRDRRTQVRWGVRDFERRFGRRPEGMWLPETAVDLETLEALVEEGIEWTVLAPHQAAEVRRAGEEEWHDVRGGRIDTARPYRQRLPSGRSIALFFYDGPLSRAVAFEKLLENGRALAERLQGEVEGGEGPRLGHVATDGETYGHHHRHGEMALSMALEILEHDELVALTNYGEHLERHPAADEVRILENTSWSCPHGVERWRSDCGCSTGASPEWNQAWRAPLREALDWLRDELEARYEREAAKLFLDPWAARDDYIEVILDRSDESLDRFLGDHARGRPAARDRVRALELLELQRHAMLMFTSCGWFFADLAGIETAQVIQYAGRAVQLGERLFGEALEPAFLERLERARSNVPEAGTGREVYHAAIEPARVDLGEIGARYAVSSLFEEYGEVERVHCYTVKRLEERRRQSGRARLALGRARVESEITRETADLWYAALHPGDHGVVGGVRPDRGEESGRALATEIESAFQRADQEAVLRLLEEAFHASTRSLRSLFGDEQRRILGRILASAGESGLPGAAALEGVELEREEVARELRDALERRVERLWSARGETDRLAGLIGLVERADELPFEVSLWGVQNGYWRLLREAYPGIRDRAARGDEAARAWVDRFRALGERLSVAIEPQVGAPAR